MNIRLLASAIVVLVATIVEAAPIYINLGDDIVRPYKPGLVVEFESVEPFRFGGFIGLGGTPTETLENPFDLGPLVYDGKYYRVSAVLPSIECGVIQVDADSSDFAGIGRLFVTGQPCTGGSSSVPQLPPTGVTPSFSPPSPPGGENPPETLTPVPEPPAWTLMTLAAMIVTWQRFVRSGAGDGDRTRDQQLGKRTSKKPA